MLTADIRAVDLFEAECLAGPDSPVHMACIEPSAQADLVNWLVLTRFRKVPPAAKLPGHHASSDLACPCSLVKYGQSPMIDTSRKLLTSLQGQ